VGAIKADGSKVLHRCPNIINSEAYQEILRTSLLPFLDSESFYMQDGAPCHRSKATLKFLDMLNVCVLSDWHAQSPDLNIIKNLWGTLKKNISRLHPKTKDELWELLQDEWRKVDVNAILELYESIPRRLKAVIIAKGLHTKY